MGFRFRKSLKIAPGVRVNLGKRGFTSVGVSKMNFGRRGAYYNITVPGTGISYRAHLGSGSQAGSQSTSRERGGSKETKNKLKTQVVQVNLQLSDDGEVSILDSKGRPVPENVATAVRQQNRELILERLQLAADNFNGDIEDLVRIHLTTPRPEGEIVLNPRPQLPKLGEAGLTGRLFGKVRERTEQTNSRVQAEYEQAVAAWQLSEQALRTDQEVMNVVLANAFSTLEWPRETSISFETREQGKLVMLDVDLPEIEDMPTEEAVVNKTQLRLNKKSRSAKAVRLDYLTHIHAIGFKLVGEVFAHLPAVETVVLSGYSQRVAKATAQTTDEYLYSARVIRDAWKKINFNNLEALDVVECFASFELHRKATATGLLSPIEPFEG